MQRLRSTIMCLFILTLTSPLYAASYSDITSQLKMLNEKYPEHTEIQDIGLNNEGEPIYVLKIENSYSNSVDKPAYLYVGVHHGNEQHTATLGMQIAKDLLNEYAHPSDNFLATLQESIVYVIPVLNISGYEKNSRREHGFDPNRDYPDACMKSDKVYQLNSTKNLSEFVRNKNIIGAVTGHGYVGTFTAPWGIYTYEPETKDHDFFMNVLSQAKAANGYRIGTHAEVIYPTSGSFEDWAYYELGVWATLIEMAYSHNIKSDSKSVLIYLSLLPEQRSSNHSHTGKCKYVRGVIESRP